MYSSKLLPILFFFAVFITGCTPIKMYPGPERPDSELAIIMFKPHSIDGQELPSRSLSTFWSREIQVLPGIHEFTLRQGFRGMEDCHTSLGYVPVYSCQNGRAVAISSTSCQVRYCTWTVNVVECTLTADLPMGAKIEAEYQSTTINGYLGTKVLLKENNRKIAEGNCVDYGSYEDSSESNNCSSSKPDC